jgi:hypothetical protein
MLNQSSVFVLVHPAELLNVLYIVLGGANMHCT